MRLLWGDRAAVVLGPVHAACAGARRRDADGGVLLGLRRPAADVHVRFLLEPAAARAARRATAGAGVCRGAAGIRAGRSRAAGRVGRLVEEAVREVRGELRQRGGKGRCERDVRTAAAVLLMIELLKRALDEELSGDNLAESLRAHAGDVSTEEIERLAQVLEDFLRSIPDALAWALALSKDPRCGRAVAFAIGPVLNYVFDDEDLLPETSFGSLGLLDDAYLVHAFAARLAQTYPFAEPQVAYTPPDAQAFQVVASLLPDGVAQALLRACASTLLVSQALLPQSPGSDGEIPTLPSIRVAEAIRTNATAG